MDNERNNPSGMTLSQVCDLLEVSSRKVQYLRESGIVSPSTVRKGRGKSCLYSEEDAVWLWVALVELDGVEYEKRREIISGLRQEMDVPLGQFSEIKVRIDGIRNKIKSLVN